VLSLGPRVIFSQWSVPCISKVWLPLEVSPGLGQGQV
jgi:hypothetical protein